MMKCDKMTESLHKNDSILTTSKKNTGRALGT